jgi:hypothetical protein
VETQVHFYPRKLDATFGLSKVSSTPDLTFLGILKMKILELKAMVTTLSIGT